MKQTINKKDEIILRKFINILRDRFSSEITRVVFFGSRAKGVSRSNSDYDLFVILRTKNPIVVRAIYSIIVDFLVQFNVDISLKIYSISLYNREEKIGVPFINEINKTGVDLWTLS